VVIVYWNEVSIFAYMTQGEKIRLIETLAAELGLKTVYEFAREQGMSPRGVMVGKHKDSMIKLLGKWWIVTK
jgi:hypothetical protein